LLGLVIPRKTMDPRLDQNQAEFRVFVLSVCLEVFAYCYGFFDQVPEIFGDTWGESCSCIIVSKTPLKRQ
jgi:hypothetical protein